MVRKRSMIIWLACLLGAGIMEPARGAAPAGEASAMPQQTEDGFAVPQPGHDFQFPRDHGSHPEFKIEWWYVTGHLWTAEKRRFGFQATFFRRAGPREEPSRSPEPSALFGRDQVYLAHMALLEAESGTFVHQERLHREGWNAGAATNALSVWNGDWSLRMDEGTSEAMTLRGGIRGEAAFQLRLLPAKPLVVFGRRGVSRKAAEPTAASYYLTYSRLRVEGNLAWEGKERPVTGQAWMDHEISSSQLGEGQEGWDWAAVQLQDGREIMAYRMRREGGGVDPYSTLAWVDASGQVTHREAGQFRLTGMGTWTSPRTGAVYPLPVRLETLDSDSGETIELRLEPLALDQELSGAVGGIAYWEGACRVVDERGEVVGSAFVELTGYAGNLRDRFR